MCFVSCVTEFSKMYLYSFHYECVCIRTSNCAFIGVNALVAVIIMCLTRIITSDTQQIRLKILKLKFGIF